MLESETVQKAIVLRWTEKCSPKQKVLRTARKVEHLRMEVTKKEHQSHCNTINANHKHLHLQNDLICFCPWEKGLKSRFWITSLVVMNGFCQEQLQQTLTDFSEINPKAVLDLTSRLEGRKASETSSLNYNLKILSEDVEASSTACQADHSLPWIHSAILHLPFL